MNKGWLYIIISSKVSGAWTRFTKAGSLFVEYYVVLSDLKQSDFSYQ